MDELLMNLRSLLSCVHLEQLIRQSRTALNRNRIKKLNFAVADQLLFSGSNFLVNILLARWMNYEFYGAFAYTYSIFLLLATFHNALLLEPYTVFGSSQHRFHLKTYTDQSTRLNLYWILAISGIGIPIGIVLLVAGSDLLGSTLLGLALAHGLSMYFVYVRRKWYVAGRIDCALIGTVIYAAGQMVAIGALWQADALTPISAFASIAAASVLAARTSHYFRFEADVTLDPVQVPIPQIIKENWSYGKWMMLSGVLFWLTGQGYNILSANILNLADVGGLKALQNLTTPITQILVAFNLVFLPWMSRRYAENSTRTLNRDLVSYAVFLTGCTITYWLGLVLFKNSIFDVLYTGRYDEYLHLLAYLALVPVITALTTSWTIGLRILRRTDLLYWLDVIGALFTITFGVLLVHRYGVSGAVAGSVLSVASRIPVLVVLWRRATRNFVCE